MRTRVTKLSVVAAVVLALTLLIAPTATAKAPWSLSGDAQSVKQGDPWAVQLQSDENSDTPHGGVSFQQPNGKLTFADIEQLSTDYNITEADCGGGSPRFSIGIDTDDDGSVDGNVFVYIGPSPNYTGCDTGWQSTGNLIQSAEPRFDTGQVGGTFYHTHADAVNLVGDDTVLYVDLVVDASWQFGVQTVLVDNVQVNNYQMTGKNAK